MKKIVFYISDHGFGHATRSLAIIRELAKNEDYRIIIKTGRPLSFIKDSLNNYSNIEYIHSPNDVGLILKENSFVVDREKMQRKVNDWVSNWEQLIVEEVKYLQTESIDLVVSDITPWVFPAAKEAGVRSIAISNFTWYDQYKKLLINDQAVEKVGEAYKDVDLFLRYPLHLEIEKAEECEDIGFLCREIDERQVERIKTELGVDKKLVFVGIGKSVDFDILKAINFQKYSEYNWLFSAGTEVEGENVFKVPEDETEVQNYIAACDYIITKAGWSTVSEAVLGQVPMLLIRRNEIPEDSKIIDKIEKMGLGLSMEIDDFYNLEIEEKFKKLDKLDLDECKFNNQSKQVAERIREVMK